MVLEQQAQYSLGRHSLADKFKPNLPFVLHWKTDSSQFDYQSIKEIDSIDRDEFLNSEISKRISIFDPVVLYFEEKVGVNIIKPVDTHTEYTLFTYLNNTRYYLARGSRYDTDDNSEQFMLELTSDKNKDIIKGDR